MLKKKDKKTIQNKKQSIFKSATFPRSIMRCASVCEEYLACCSSHRKKGNPFVYAPQFRQERPKQLPFPSWEIPCPTLKILDDRGFHCFPNRLRVFQQMKTRSKSNTFSTVWDSRRHSGKSVPDFCNNWRSLKRADAPIYTVSVIALVSC